jgi:hypothetical protein
MVVKQIIYFGTDGVKINIAEQQLPIIF